MQHIIDSVIITQKLERCHKAVKGILDPADWQDNFNQWKLLIEAHQKKHAGKQMLESVVELATSIEGHYYSQMTLFAVAFELLTNDNNHN